MAPWNLWVMVLSITAFGMSVSFEQFLYSYMPGPLSNMFNETFQKHYGTQLDSIGLSTVISAMSIVDMVGIFVGIFFVLPLLDSRGRKFVAIYLRFAMVSVVAVLQILSWWLPSVECFLLSMFFAGVATFIQSTSTILFIAECSSNQNRGTFTMVNHIGGTICTLILNTLCRPSVFGNDENWVFLPTIALFLSILHLLSNIRIPDSPIWLVSQGKNAGKAIEFYRGKDVDSDELIFQLKLETKVKSVDKMSFKKVWTDKPTREVLLVLMAMVSSWMILSPLSIEMSFYVILLEKLGIGAEDAMTLKSVISLLSIPVYLGGTFLIDRVGRRQVFFAGSAAMFLKGLAICSGLMISSFVGPSLLTRLLAVVGQLFSILWGASGVFILDNILLCELLPAAARVSVAQLILVSPMVFSVPLRGLVPIAFDLFSPSLYILFLVFQPICVLYVYRNLVETKNKPVYEVIEEIDDVIRSRSTTRLSNARSSLISSKDIKRYQTIN